MDFKQIIDMNARETEAFGDHLMAMLREHYKPNSVDFWLAIVPFLLNHDYAGLADACTAAGFDRTYHDILDWMSQITMLHVIREVQRIREIKELES